MYKTTFEPTKDNGMYYFISEKPFDAHKKQRGFGKIEYYEGSIYEGDLYYDGGSFYKMGFGEQEFSHSVISSGDFGATSSLKLFKFVGFFDCKKCDWMYGNGIVYFTDENGAPKAFIKGFFNRTVKISEWKGKFSEKDLLDGFTPDMEISQQPSIKFTDKAAVYAEKFKDIKECDFLVFGDSWTDFWQDTQNKNGGTFYDDIKIYAKGVLSVNVGIGGTKYCDWFDLIYDIVIPYRPKKIFVHLGGNDLAAKFGVKKTFANFIRIAKSLKKALPETKFYVSAVCPILDYNSYDEETKLNEYTEKYCAENGLFFVKTDSVFKKDGKVMPNVLDYFIEDKIHLNLKGYEIWGKYVLESIFKK